MTRQVRTGISRFSCATFAFASALTLNEGLANAQNHEERRTVAAVTVQTLTPRPIGERTVFNFDGNSITSYAVVPRDQTFPSFSLEVPPGNAVLRFRFYPLVRQRRHHADVDYSLRYEVDGTASSVSAHTSPTTNPDPLSGGRHLRVGSPVDFQITLTEGNHTVRFGEGNPNGLVQLVTADFTPAPTPEPAPVTPPPTTCNITCPANHVLNSASCSCNPVIPITPRVVNPPLQRPVDLSLGPRISVSSNGFYSPSYLGGSLDVNLIRRLRPNLGLSFGGGALVASSDASSATHAAGMYVASPYASVGIRANVRSIIFDARLLAGVNIQGVSETSPNSTNQFNFGVFAGFSGSLTSRFVYASLVASNSPLSPLHLQVGYPSIPSWVRNQKIRAGLDFSLIRPAEIDGRTLNLGLDALIGASVGVPIVQIGSVIPILNLNGGLRVGTTDHYFGAGLTFNTN